MYPLRKKCSTDICRAAYTFLVYLQLTAAEVIKTPPPSR